MLRLFNKLNPLAFLIALCVGLFACYITTPAPRIVIKYPTPDNSGIVTYIDKNSNCYHYKAKEVTCPKDKSLISEYPQDEEEQQ